MEGAQRLKALEAAWRRDPQAVFVRLAAALRAAGELDRAATVLRDGLSRWPHNLAAHVGLAEVLVEQGEPAAAEAALEPVFERAADHWAALDLLARLRRSAGDRPGELAVLRRLARQAPADRGVARRIELAERQLATPAAPAAPAPGAPGESTPAPPGYQSQPTIVMKPVPPSPLGRARVSTTPSAQRPQRPVATRVTDPHGVRPRLLRRTEVLRTHPGAGQPLPGIPRASRPPPAPDPFANETMVELLVDQGRLDEARSLLGELIAREPGRRSLARRLMELGGPGPSAEASDRPAPTDLESLMQSVLSSAADALDELADPGETST